MSFGLSRKVSTRARNYRQPGQPPVGAWVVVIFLIIALMSIFS